MEDQITHLCGGYYRSFKKFKMQVEAMSENTVFLQDCARFLQQISGEDTDEKRKRFTRLFFKTYGKQLAGNCGCSNLVFDYQRIRVNQRKLFVSLMHALVSMNVIDCHSDHLAEILYAAFDTGYELSTLKVNLRENTLLAGQLYNKLKPYIEK